MFDAQDVSAVPGDLSGAPSLPAPSAVGGTGSIHLLDRLNAVFKHRRLAATAFVIVVTLMMIQTYSTTPIYQAASRIQIDDEKTTNLSNIQNNDVYFENVYEYRKTQVQILQSRDLAKRVVEKLGASAFAAPPAKARDPISLFRDARVSVGSYIRGLFSRQAAPPADVPAPDEDSRTAAMVGALIGGLKIIPDADTRLVYIQYTHTDPQFAARVANVIAEQYTASNMDRRLAKFKTTIEWVNSQVEDQGKKLADAEAALLQYRERNNAQGLSRQELLSQRLSTLQGQAVQATATRQQKENTYALVKNADAADNNVDANTVIGTNPAVVDAKGALRSAEAKLQQLTRDGFGESYGPVVTARAEVTNAKEKLVAARRTVIETVRQDYLASVTSERAVQAQLNAVKDEANGLDVKAVDYNKLQRDAETIRTVYNGLVTQQKELAVVSDSRQNNVQIIERAEVPKVPIAPQPKKEWIQAILMGVLVAFGLAFGIEYLDDTVKTPDDITRRLRVPLLGLVPAIRGDRVPLLTEPVPHDFGEAFRSLRTSLVFTAAGEHTRVIAVTSSQPLEGKTTTAANLALALALGGARVLVVDADMRRPGLHKTLRLPNNIGLSHLLQGQARVREAVQRTSEPNLLAISAGRTPPNPSELLGSERMSNFIANLQKGPFDWVIIDTPPVLAVTDAVVLAPKISGMVFVVGSEMTRLVHAERALETIRASRPRAISAVLNRVDFDRNKYYYSRYYGYQYKSYYGQSTQGAA